MTAKRSAKKSKKTLNKRRKLPSVKTLRPAGQPYLEVKLDAPIITSG